jgi:lysophospholipase L1-like esterase
MQDIATPSLARRVARFVFVFSLASAAFFRFADTVAAPAQSPHWVAAWAASAQGPYPVGNPSAQPELKFAFPDAARGAVDQSFRLIVRPDVWGKQARIRLSNAFGTQPVTFDGVYVALQNSGSAVLAGTSRPVTFLGNKSVTVAPGKDVLSDAVSLPFVKNATDPMLTGRRLAVSFHVAGESGPMTWHAKALTTSYITAPGGGSHGADEGESAFSMSSASWYFLDAVEMTAPPATRVIVAFGDSITDGTASTLNGDDRWPDVFARRLHAIAGNRFVVVNEGIGGNEVVGPPDYAAKPTPGGPSALDRLQRDVISLPGVSAVIWLEGINDFGARGASVQAVSDGVVEGVKRLRAAIPGVRIYMATLTGALNSTPTHGTPEVEAKRKEYNQFIRSAGIFDGVIDFDVITLDPATGELKAVYQPNSTVGGPGDKLHPNRAGYAAMGNAVDLKMIVGK